MPESDAAAAWAENRDEKITRQTNRLIRRRLNSQMLAVSRVE